MISRAKVQTTSMEAIIKAVYSTLLKTVHSMHAQVLLAKHGDMEAQLSPLSEIVSPDVTASIGMPRVAPAR